MPIAQRAEVIPCTLTPGDRARSPQPPGSRGHAAAPTPVGTLRGGSQRVIVRDGRQSGRV